MEYSKIEVSATPGQLWKNIRTGNVLFVYKKGSRTEGILCDGRKINDKDLIKIKNGISGWQCVYSRNTSEDFITNHDSYEFRAL